MHKAWLKSLRDQCCAANVPFFFKQWGGVKKGKNGRTYRRSRSGIRTVSGPAVSIAGV
jgi:protein gp37